MEVMAGIILLATPVTILVYTVVRDRGSASLYDHYDPRARLGEHPKGLGGRRCIACQRAAGKLPEQRWARLKQRLREIVG